MLPHPLFYISFLRNFLPLPPFLLSSVLSMVHLRIGILELHMCHHGHKMVWVCNGGEIPRVLSGREVEDSWRHVS